MKKAWPYISAALAGMVLGIIIAVKWLVQQGDKISVEIKKLKNKRVSGEGGNITIPVNVEAENGPKNDRKLDRLQRRVERRKEKALKRIDNV